MKKIASIMLAMAGVMFFGCNEYDNPELNPNESIENPSFEVTVGGDASGIAKEGGEIEITVTTNAVWWTVTSSRTWAVVPSDQIEGSCTIVMTVDPYNEIGSRSGALNFKIGTEGLEKEVVIIQKGIPSELHVDPVELDFDGYGGIHPLNVSSNGNWVVEVTMLNDNGNNWCTASVTQGQGNQSVNIRVDRNTDAMLPSRSAIVRITSADVVVEVSIVQTGNASEYDIPENTYTIYFDAFVPDPEAATLSTWTLTDSRDGKTYRVRKMDDGQIWMIQDLKFAGDAKDGVVPTAPRTFTGQTINPNTTFFADGYYGACFEQTNSPVVGAGYYYNWLAVMQDVRAATDGNNANTQIFTPTLPHQGIAPDGWHVPSIDEYTALHTAMGSDATKWYASGSWEGVFGGNLGNLQTSHWGKNANGNYATSTQVTSTTVSDYRKKSYVWKINNAVTSTSTPASVEKTEALKDYGYVVRLVKNNQ